MQNLTVTTSDDPGIISSIGSQDGGIGIIVGHNDGTVQNCITSGTVNVNEQQNMNLGGIAGTNSGTINNCTNNARVSYLSSDDMGYVGGITGKNDGGTVENCINEGYVSGTTGWFSCGGIVGITSSEIKDCINKGGVSIGGSGVIGGVVGTINSGEVENCGWCNDVANAPDKGVGSGDDNTTPLSETQLSSVINTLSATIDKESIAVGEAGAKITFTFAPATVLPETSVLFDNEYGAVRSMAVKDDYDKSVLSVEPVQAEGKFIVTPIKEGETDITVTVDFHNTNLAYLTDDSQPQFCSDSTEYPFDFHVKVTAAAASGGDNSGSGSSGSGGGGGGGGCNAGAGALALLALLPLFALKRGK